MNRTRLALWAAGAALLAAWLSSAAGTTPGAAPPPAVGSAPPPAAPAPAERVDLDREVERMTAWIERAPRPRPVVRNPFALAPLLRPSDAAREGSGGVAVPAGWAPNPAAAPAAPLRVSLVGIAVDETPSGPRRTAVLSVEGQVVLAQVGDEAPGPYEVRRIEDDAVELFDPGRETAFRLQLP